MTSIFDQVKAALAPRLPEVLAELLPGGRISGREYVCASLQGDAGTSCATNLETGKGSDFATGESWGDVIALAAKVWNMRQGEAAQELARLYHIDAGQGAPQPLRQAAAFSVILPVPDAAPQPPRPFHAVVPSISTWRFHTGRSALIASMTRRHTSKAVSRWAAATSTRTAARSWSGSPRPPPSRYRRSASRRTHRRTRLRSRPTGMWHPG